MPHQELNSREQLSQSSSLGFSETRGNMHGFGIESEDAPALILANGGAQLMNSPHYLERHSSDLSYGIVKSNERALAAYMMAFTKPQDTLAFTTDNPTLSRHVLDQIHHFYEQIGIETTMQYEPVSDVDEIGIENGVIPHILSPEILAHFGMEETSDRNVSAYKKDVTEKLWRETGVPVPPTAYVRSTTHEQELSQRLGQFSDYEDLVVNITDGSGGFGLTFINRQEAHNFIRTSQQGFVNGELLQIQGKLPLVSSPCVILNISEQGINILTTSEQRFSAPGAHGGNVWTKDFAQQLSAQYPDFDKTILDAARALQQYGVRGQINMDALITSEENSARFGVPVVSMREANIRPAGSSILLRMQQEGVINNQKVSKIVTNTSTHLPPSLFLRSSIVDTINHRPDMKTVMYNYTPEGKVGMAFLGNDNVSISELEQYEKDTLYSLHSWR
jgi:hypothetical protein